MHTTDQVNTALEGKYAIERRIGAGGMAVVYLARDLLPQSTRRAQSLCISELATLVGSDGTPKRDTLIVDVAIGAMTDNA